MKQWKIYCASGFFVLLTAVKLFLPEASAALRMKTQEVLAFDTDYISALERLEERISPTAADVRIPEQTPWQQVTDPPLSTTGPILVPVNVPPNTAADTGTAGAEAFVLPEAAEPETPEAEQSDPRLPEAVSAFLERQEAFADYSLPENVDYTYTELPFDYAVPVSGSNSSGFGYRIHPILNAVRFHYGTDFAANTGEAVLAFADGTVTLAAYDDSYGWHVKIDHGGGWVSHCAHCSQLFVSVGQQVSRGDQIAHVGATGLATGPHLHFELTRDGNYVNPEYYVNE